MKRLSEQMRGFDRRDLEDGVHIQIADAVALLEDAIEQAFGILTDIPEDLDSWEKANASIQEAHDILEAAKLEKQL